MQTLSYMPLRWVGNRRAKNVLWLGLASLALSGLSVTADEPTLADPNVDLIDTPTWQLITDLDSDAFRVRQHSKQKIRSRLEAPADDQEIIRCLQFAQQHGSVEMQLQAGRWLRTR
ncbi:MAG: hypothetical protein AAGA03_16840, partial [Planctomycetota bacterium]